MKGRLIYLIGPSGSGKDSVLEAARERLTERGVQIVQRVITRSAQAQGEHAQAVSREQFEQMAVNGAFAMSWQANGLCYGIPVLIDDWLAAGSDVLVNGSRGHLPQVRQRYPNLLVILLQVKPEVLRQRLIARQRETIEEIERRLARNDDFGRLPGDVHLLDNSGDLELAAQRLLHIIDQ